MLTSKDQIEHELSLTDNRRVNAIKDAYYKAAEGLRALADELEMADVDLCGNDEERSELLNLHLHVCSALEAMKPVQVLGKLL